MSHGLIEALAGMPIPWPPRAPKQSKITEKICMEARDQAEMLDWHDYADLRLYGALHANQQGCPRMSRSLYRSALADFAEDGKGFADKAFNGLYATYKLALALYVGVVLNEPVDPVLLRALLGKQFADGDYRGGFVTLYTSAGPVNDSNTEATAYAVLALSAVDQCLRSGACDLR